MTVEITALRNETSTKKYKIVIVIILLLSIVNINLTMDAVSQNEFWPVADGMFIQPFLVKDWDDGKWLM